LATDEVANRRTAQEQSSDMKAFRLPTQSMNVFGNEQF
jgi:hypothetical protein